MRHLTLALAALLLNAPQDAADKDAIVSGNTRFVPGPGHEPGGLRAVVLAD